MQGVSAIAVAECVLSSWSSGWQLTRALGSLGLLCECGSWLTSLIPSQCSSFIYIDLSFWLTQFSNIVT